MVLDNFEHVLSAAPLVGDLLAACPGVKVLATSREALNLQAEHRYEVMPLRVPAEGRPVAVARSAAGALFVERARSHDRTFELNANNAAAVADVCRRLDGLPLAIELAAARIPVIGLEQLNARLTEALDLLSGGSRDAPERHRALRATIEWSHRLLDADEAKAFGHFAVFAGGATIEAAEEVTCADLETLSGLVDKHLLGRSAPDGEPRLVMLQTVREYASERLETAGTLRRCVNGIAATTGPLRSRPSPNCSPTERRNGCPGWTSRSTTSARRSTGASFTLPSKRCGSSRR